ncbi:MAG: protein-L-isoaspartate(D-aspartate) O-methyltransferase [Sphingomonadales bacterium]|nr:protein-L-isoaspartate(D-aspartate) O-methyltransferase [Sphingomonadales bacterium]
MADYGYNRRDRMVERQIMARGIDDTNLLHAMREVPREVFVPENLAEFAYDDTPLPIAEGQTISQPYIVAAMIEAAEVQPGDKVLEVGAGSGYAAAVLSRIADRVFAIERHKPLADAAERRLGALGYRNVSVIAGDGSGGLPGEAPFDAILVAARGPEAPEALKRQLKIGGRLVIPVGGEDLQTLWRVTRTAEAEWTSDALEQVRFVPLIGAHGIPEDGSRAATDHRPARDKPLHELVGQAAEPLPELDDPEFARAFDRFADRRIVMLGECSHGTHEFYAARAAITRRLVERHGFTVIAVEADWPDAAAIDRYIGHGEARPGAPPTFQRFPTWMWRNTVIAGLADDLRAHNAQVADKARRAGFYGLDIYNMSGSIEAVLAYLDREDPEAAKVARERYGCLTPWQSDPATYGRFALSVGFAECEQAVVAQCRELLDKALADPAHDGDGLLDAAMNARLVASAERYYRIMYYGGAESWNLRDSHMADTLEHLLEARGPGTKAVVWAHNSHIGDASATDMGRVRGEHNIGQLIRERFAGEVALVGFGTHTGTVTCATDWDGHTETKRVLPSRRDSHERLCHDAGIPRFLLDLPAHDMLRRRLAEPRLERFIGVIYRPETERWSHYSEAVLPSQFDAYVWFDETRALTPLAEEHLPGHVPDTYPFGL